MITKTDNSIFNHYLVDKTSFRDKAHHYTTYCAFYDQNYNDFTSWKASLHIIRSLFHRTRSDTFKISPRLPLLLFNDRCMFSYVMSAVSKSFVLFGFVTSVLSSMDSLILIYATLTYLNLFLQFRENQLVSGYANRWAFSLRRCARLKKMNWLRIS